MIGRRGAYASFPSYLDRLVTGSRITMHSFTSPNLQKYSLKPSAEDNEDSKLLNKLRKGGQVFSTEISTHTHVLLRWPERNNGVGVDHVVFVSLQTSQITARATKTRLQVLSSSSSSICGIITRLTRINCVQCVSARRNTTMRGKQQKRGNKQTHNFQV